MDYTAEQLTEQYNKLPDNIKEVIANSETEDKVIEIGKTHNLHIDQVGLLADEIGLVLLGLAPSADLMAKLQNRLQVDRVTSENLAADINTQIFLPIRDALQQLTEKQGELPAKADILRDIENPPAAPAPVIAAPVTPTAIATPVPAIVSTESGPTPIMPAPVAPPTPSVFEQKMAGSFSLPKDEPALGDPYRETLK